MVQITERKKKYYAKNKDRIAEKHKEYCEKNKEQLVEQRKNRYEKNKVQLAEQRKENVECECGCIVRKYGLANHRRTQKHKDLMAQK